jgi:hypothetical protein
MNPPRVGLNLAPDHNQCRIEDRDVRKPLLKPRLKVRRAADLCQLLARLNPPKALIAHTFE